MGVVSRSLRLLFPSGFAWRLPGQLGTLVDALALSFDRQRLFFRGILAEALPGSAEDMLPEWYGALGIPYDASLDLIVRRARAEAAYSATGGQSFNYLEGRLQAELPNTYIEEAAIEDPGVAAIAGIGRAGLMRAGSPNPLHAFSVLGTVETDEEYDRLVAILWRYFPLHTGWVINVTVGT